MGCRLRTGRLGGDVALVKAYKADRMGNLASFFTAKAGGLADVSAALVSALFDQGADVHVALPDYRSMTSSQTKTVVP